jgi:hypothetical protein
VNCKIFIFYFNSQINLRGGFWRRMLVEILLMHHPAPGVAR